jgi:hypothetical protein
MIIGNLIFMFTSSVLARVIWGKKYGGGAIHP